MSYQHTTAYLRCGVGQYLSKGSDYNWQAFDGMGRLRQVIGSGYHVWPWFVARGSGSLTTEIGDEKNYADLIRQLLTSEGYLQRLQYIHSHYQNVKNEVRYRDAFLEEFKKRHGAEGLEAYAEVKKVDLVIVNPEADERVRIEFKYQYTFDMAYRVARRVDDFDALRGLVTAGGQGVAERIVRDCDGCDIFVLIVQDRTGHPASGRLPGGVDAAFIDDQYWMDRKFGAGSDQNKKAWLEPTQKLLDGVCHAYGGSQPDPVELVVGDAENPLTSHFFVIDRTNVMAAA